MRRRRALSSFDSPVDGRARRNRHEAGVGHQFGVLGQWGSVAWSTWAADRGEKYPGKFLCDYRGVHCEPMRRRELPENGELVGSPDECVVAGRAMVLPAEIKEVPGRILHRLAGTVWQPDDARPTRRACSGGKWPIMTAPLDPLDQTK